MGEIKQHYNSIRNDHEMYNQRIEYLAEHLHEAGREAVEKKATVNPNTHSKFLEWSELKDHMKEGRRIQAKYLDKYFEFTLRC